MTYQYPGKNRNQKRRKRGGRPPRLSDLSRQAIDAEAQRLMDRNPSDHLWDVIDILAPNGVLSTEQLRFLVSYWTLRDNYAPHRVVDRLSFTRTEVSETLSEYGLPVGDHPGLYALGPVGIELAKRRDLVPITGYQAYPLRRVMHDVVLNEIVFRLADFAEEQGVPLRSIGDYASTIKSGNGKVKAPKARR